MREEVQRWYRENPRSVAYRAIAWKAIRRAKEEHRRRSADRSGQVVIDLLVVVAGGGALVVSMAGGLSTLSAAGAAYCIGIVAGLWLGRETKRNHG